MLRRHIRERIFDPDLVVVGHLALLEEFESLDGLNEVASELGKLLLRQVKLRPLQVIHVVDEHLALDVDADEVLLAILMRCPHKLSEHENALIEELLERLSLEGFSPIRRLFSNDLLNLVLSDNDSHRFCPQIEIIGERLTLLQPANLQRLSASELHHLLEFEVGNIFIPAELEHALLPSAHLTRTSVSSRSSARCVLVSRFSTLSLHLQFLSDALHARL